jgi:RNA ligase (TIGR02306 family)
MRKLASIQTVSEVEVIANADTLERLRILGWWVVAKKGEFKPGDRLVYCEIDSLMPERPEFEFLRPSSYKAAIVEGGSTIQRAGFRIKTVKLRGQVSQGICFPLSILPQGVFYVFNVLDVDAFKLLDRSLRKPIESQSATRGDRLSPGSRVERRRHWRPPEFQGDQSAVPAEI